MNRCYRIYTKLCLLGIAFYSGITVLYLSAGRECDDIILTAVRTGLNVGMVVVLFGGYSRPHSYSIYLTTSWWYVVCGTWWLVPTSCFGNVAIEVDFWVHTLLCAILTVVSMFLGGIFVRRNYSIHLCVRN